MVVHGLVLLLTLAQAAPPRAQTGPRDADLTALAGGWTSAGAGQYEAAAKAADAVLLRRPWDHAAHVLRIYALAKASPDRGLDAYEQWLKISHTEDAAVLEPVTIAVLQRIATGPKAELHELALRALSLARVAGAPSAPDPAAADEQELLQRARSANPQTRAGAVEALGGVKTAASRSAVAALKQDPDPMVRTAASISLARMGDPEGLAAVEGMLASGVPEVQIMASRAFEGKPGPWVDKIRPLLDNQDGLTRLEAAQAIAPVDPEAARRVLGTALADTNPVVRYESARTLADTPGLLADADIATLRQRLRDADVAVRLAAAGALLRLARQ